MIDYDELKEQAGNTIRYVAHQDGIAIFISVSHNIIASSTCATKMNDDTVLKLPLRKGDEVKALFPLDLIRFVPVQEYLEHTKE